MHGPNKLEFAPGMLFQPTLMIEGKPGAYPRVEHLKFDSD
jgi:hypothetical protein